MATHEQVVEQTLQDLLQAVRNMGPSSGGAGGAGDTPEKVQKKEIDAKKANTKETSLASKSLKTFGLETDKTAKALGMLEKSYSTNAAKLSSFTDVLSNHVPIFGSSIKMLGQVTQTNIDVFRKLSTVGAAFGDGITEFRRSAAEAGLSVDGFTAIIEQNSQNFATMATSVAEGTKRFVDISKVIQTKYTPIFAKLGFQFDELGKYTASYLTQQTLLGRTQRMSTFQLAKGSEEYALQLDKLARATGLSREQLDKANEAAMRDINMRNALSKLSVTDQQRITAITTKLGTIDADMEAGIKDIIRYGGNILTDQAREAFQAAGEAGPALQEFGRAVSRGTATAEDLDKIIQQTAKSGANMTMKEKSYASILDQGGIKFMRMRSAMDQYTNGILRDAVVQEEQNRATADRTRMQAAFDQKLQELSNTLSTALLPYMTIMAERLVSLAEKAIPYLQTAISKLPEIIENTLSFFTNTEFRTKTILGFVDFLKNMVVEATPGFVSAFESMRDYLLESSIQLSEFLLDKFTEYVIPELQMFGKMLAIDIKKAAFEMVATILDGIPLLGDKVESLRSQAAEAENESKKLSVEAAEERIKRRDLQEDNAAIRKLNKEARAKEKENLNQSKQHAEHLNEIQTDVETTLNKFKEILSSVVSLIPNIPGMAATPTATGDALVDQILATIRTRESGSAQGNYSAKNPSPGSTASGAYQFTDATWKERAKAVPGASQFSSARQAPADIQDAVAAAYVKSILQESGNRVEAVPTKWYTGNIAGKMSAETLAKNRGFTTQKYVEEWMKVFGTVGPGTGAGLSVKGGLGGQAFAGGETAAGTMQLAQNLQNLSSTMPGGLNQFTAFNDKFHQGRNSMHNKGLAFDYTLADTSKSTESEQFVRDLLLRSGMSEKDFKIIDEYKHPSEGATGGHIHVNFSSTEAADKFAQLSGTRAGLTSTSDTAQAAAAAAVAATTGATGTQAAPGATSNVGVGPVSVSSELLDQINSNAAMLVTLTRESIMINRRILAASNKKDLLPTAVA